MCYTNFNIVSPNKCISVLLSVTLWVCLTFTWGQLCECFVALCANRFDILRHKYRKAMPKWLHIYLCNLVDKYCSCWFGSSSFRWICLFTLTFSFHQKVLHSYKIQNHETTLILKQDQMYSIESTYISIPNLLLS